MLTDEGIEMGELGDKEVDEENKTSSQDEVDADISRSGDIISTRNEGNNENAEHGVIEDLQDICDQMDADNSNIDCDSDETPAGTTLKDKTDFDIVEETDNVENEENLNLSQITKDVECAQEVGAYVGNTDDEITTETVDNEAESENVEERDKTVTEIEEQTNTDYVGVDNTEKEATEDEDINEEELLGIGEEGNQS